MIRKTVINLLIILVWLVFGYGYFRLFMVEREAFVEETDGAVSEENGEQAGGGSGPGGLIMAGLAENGRTIQPDTLCLSTSILVDPAWTNPAFQQAVGELHVGALRIPGGEAAGFWNWQSNRIGPLGPQLEPKAVDNNFESYLAGFKGTGTVPIVTLNMVTADLADQLALLQALEDGGLPVTAVELGYRAYLGQPDAAGQLTFATVDEYTGAAAIWAAAIRSEFPEVAIGLSAAPPTFAGFQAWNGAVFELAASQDLAVSFYPYPEPVLEAGHPFNEGTVSAVLGGPFQSWASYTADGGPLATLSPEVTVWLPEYNIWPESTEQAVVAGTWGQSLFVASQSLLFLGDERVEYICPQQLLGPQKSAAYAFKDEGFELLPTGRAVQMLGLAMEGMTAAREIVFDNMALVEGPAGVEYPPLLGWQFSDENGRQSAVFINLGAAPLEIGMGNLPADFPERYRQLIGVPIRRVRGNEGVEAINGDLAERDGRFLVLPHYSITVLTQ